MTTDTQSLMGFGDGIRTWQENDRWFYEDIDGDISVSNRYGPFKTEQEAIDDALGLFEPFGRLCQ